MSDLPIELGAMSYAQVAELLASPGIKLVLLPTGSTEAHGPHLPLATDSIIAEHMARRAAPRLRALGHPTVVAPTLHYAVTEWAAEFAGSAGISPATARAVLTELATRFAAMGFDATVLINAHLEPDNIATLRSLERDWQGPGKLVFPDKTRRRNAERLTEEFRSGSCHAGQYETSLVLAATPDLVSLEQARALPAHPVALHEHIAKGAQGFLACGLDQAYCGDPAAGTVEEGHASYDELAAIVVESVLAAIASG